MDDTPSWVTHQRSDTPPTPGMPLGWQIMWGVAGGILLASAITWGIFEWRARVAVAEAAAAVQHMTAEAEKNFRRSYEREAHRSAQLEAEKDAREQIARRQKQDQQLLVQRQQQAQRDAVEQREAAWSRFYQKPARCLNDPSPEMLVQCANEHIRARRKFDEQHAASKLH